MARTAENREQDRERDERTTSQQQDATASGQTGRQGQGGDQDDWEQGARSQQGWQQGRGQMQPMRGGRQTGMTRRGDYTGGAWSPFSIMSRFADEMDRMFDDFGFGGVFGPGISRGMMRPTGGQMMQSMWMPDIEVSQRGNQLLIKADLPGLNRDDVRVQVEDGELTIQGERREEQEQNQGDIYRSERRYGFFQRAIPLPDGVSEDQIRARFRNGVLEITVPMSGQQRQRGRQVQIEDEQGQDQGQRQGQGKGQDRERQESARERM